MSENVKGSFLSSYWAKLAIGLALMLFGMYGSQQGWGTPEFVHEIGLPLDLMKTVAVIGVFIILFPVLNYFYFTPLKESIDDRTSTLEATFGEAEDLRAEMNQLKADYERRIADTEAQAREQIQAEVRKAQQMRQEIMAEASEKADELYRRAQEDIAAERDRVIIQMRIEVADLALQATERILGEQADEQTSRRLVEEFLQKVEVPQK